MQVGYSENCTFGTLKGSLLTQVVFKRRWSQGQVRLSISGSGWCSNRTLCDTNLKFGTMIEYDQTNIFRYRAIADSSCRQNGRQRFLYPTYLSL